MNNPLSYATLLSPLQLAEYLDCYDSNGVPDAQTILKLSQDGSLPPPDFRRGGEVFWYRKTITEFIDKLNGVAAAPEPLLIDGKALAKMVSKSERWVVANRHRIPGAQKVGGEWRYSVDIIQRRIIAGLDIVDPPSEISKKHRKKIFRRN
jgi:hypothetical protein